MLPLQTTTNVIKESKLIGVRENGNNSIYLGILTENTNLEYGFELHKVDEIEYKQAYTN